MSKENYYKRDAQTQNLTRTEKIKIILWRIVQSILFKPTLTPFSAWRVFLLRLFGAKIGTGCYISPQAFFYRPWNLVMGDFSSIDDFSYIKSSTPIIIGDYVSIAAFVHIIPDGHDVRARNFAHVAGEIHIGHSAFIGADTFIGKGVSIGQMAVIGARSVVMKDIPENVIAFGAPCRVMSERLSEEEYSQYIYHNANK